MCAHGVGELDAHVPKTAQADNSDFLTRSNFPMLEWRVSRNPGAKQRRGGGWIQIFRDMQNKVFTHGDSFGITAERMRILRPTNFVFTVVCCCPSVLTILFQPIVTGFAMAAAIDQTTHADNIAWFKFCNGISNRAHAANDLVTGHNGIMRSTPLIARRMNIRMADAAIQNINHYIYGARRPTFKHKRGKLVSRGMTGVSICFQNQVSFFYQLALVLFSLARVLQP